VSNRQGPHPAGGGTPASPRAGEKRHWRNSLEKAPEDLPRRNENAVTPGIIPADVHEPDEAALSTARNRKCASKIWAVELLVVLLAGDLPPTLPVRRRLDQARFQMIIAPRTIIGADCVACWANSPLLDLIANPIVPCVRNLL
jgi:hypothetical protein